MSEPCRLRRGEGYGVRDDEAPRSRCPCLPRHGRHVPIEVPLTKARGLVPRALSFPAFRNRTDCPRR